LTGGRAYQGGEGSATKIGWWGGNLEDREEGEGKEAEEKLTSDRQYAEKRKRKEKRNIGNGRIMGKQIARTLR